MGRVMAGITSGTPSRACTLDRKKPVYLKTAKSPRQMTKVRISHSLRREESAWISRPPR